MIRSRTSLSVLLATMVPSALVLAICSLTGSPNRAIADQEATETFHIAEISKLMVGYNGDTGVQAVEIKMTTAGQNLVNGMTIAIYDGSGTLVATLGAFTANVANSASGDHILCATAKFRDTFGITPDLLITPLVPVTSGQVAYEKVGCRVNVLPYGTVTTPLTSPTAAPALPASGVTVLVRSVDDPTTPTCPLSENAGSRFTLTQGGPGTPITFFNNARLSVNVAANVVGVGGTAAPAAQVVRVFPNPFRGSTRIDAPAWAPLNIYDIRGRLIRVLTCLPQGACPDVSGPFRGVWDGLDENGAEAPSGIYFVRYSGPGGDIVKRFALIR